MVDVRSAMAIEDRQADVVPAVYNNVEDVRYKEKKWKFGRREGRAIMSM